MSAVAAVEAATSPATALRSLCVVLGALLVVRALSIAMRGGRSVSRNDETSRPLRHLAGRLVAAAAHLGTRCAPLHRAGDATTLPSRLAAAPASWPAGWVGAGLAAARGRHPVAGLSGLMCGVRLLCAVALAVLCTLPAILLAGTAALAVAPVAAVGGAALPDIVLARAARKESLTGEGMVAAAVDLLAATTSAGLTLPAAMELTAGHAPPAVAAALHAAAVRRASGEEPTSALTVEAARFRIPALADVGLAVERQRRLGTPLGPELGHIAARLRADHRARAMERITRRVPVATLIVALVIAPICLAALIACLVGGIVQGGTLGLR
ncbi:MAG TPA: type II secretion system F family protein [Candidatus Dormibacteraeota bacterium]|jgi:Flp pilus assembly protein TadB|nr:type II secretion system F family protein [Candidatus Dormibacteraeota bacterium]